MVEDVESILGQDIILKVDVDDTVLIDTLLLVEFIIKVTL